MQILPYEAKYWDDMIFMVLEAKNALGRIPTLNEDLLDIPAYYLDRGDAFWLAVSEEGRVVGCIGCNTLENPEDAKLHRLYVKYDRKRQGIGSALLETAESALRARGAKAVYVHLGGTEYWESRFFYPKHGYTECAPNWMRKVL